MTLETVFILLVPVTAGIVLTYKYMHKKPRLRIICLVLLSVIELALIGYIAASAILIDAIRHQPPSP